MRIRPAPGPSRRQDGRSSAAALQTRGRQMREGSTPRARSAASLNAATSTNDFAGRARAGPRPPGRLRTRRAAPRRPRVRPRTGRGRSTARTRRRGYAARRRGPRARRARRRGRARAVPRQPAWTAAIQPVAASARRIGTQSAEATTRRTFGWQVARASPVPRMPVRRFRAGSSKVSMTAPWTWVSLITSASGAPSAAASARGRDVRIEAAGRQRAAREARGEPGRAGQRQP